MVEIDWRPDTGKLRVFGEICLVAFGGIGTWIYFRQTFMFFPIPAPGAHGTGIALWSLAGLCGLLALVAPPALRPLYVGLMLVSFPIGLVVSYVALALVYYGLITPIGLVFRIRGRDALARRYEPARATYWTRREAHPSKSRYFQQF